MFTSEIIPPLTEFQDSFRMSHSTAGSGTAPLPPRHTAEHKKGKAAPPNKGPVIQNFTNMRKSMEYVVARLRPHHAKEEKEYMYLDLLRSICTIAALVRGDAEMRGLLIIFRRTMRLIPELDITLPQRYEGLGGPELGEVISTELPAEEPWPALPAVSAYVPTAAAPQHGTSKNGNTTAKKDINTFKSTSSKPPPLEPPPLDPPQPHARPHLSQKPERNGSGSEPPTLQSATAASLHNTVASEYTNTPPQLRSNSQPGSYSVPQTPLPSPAAPSVAAMKNPPPITLPLSRIENLPQPMQQSLRQPVQQPVRQSISQPILQSMQPTQQPMQQAVQPMQQAVQVNPTNWVLVVPNGMNGYTVLSAPSVTPICGANVINRSNRAIMRMHAIAGHLGRVRPESSFHSILARIIWHITNECTDQYHGISNKELDMIETRFNLFLEIIDFQLDTHPSPNA